MKNWMKKLFSRGFCYSGTLQTKLIKHRNYSLGKKLRVASIKLHPVHLLCQVRFGEANNHAVLI